MMLITDGATPLSHAQFRATLRHVMSTMDERMKGVNLAHHTVNSFIDAGTSPASKADNNAEISQMQYQVAFNIKPDAWPITE